MRRLRDWDRLLSVLDLGATPPCEKFLAADELDSPEPTFPLHLRLCEDLQDTFTAYAYFSSYFDSWAQHAKKFVDDAAERLGAAGGSPPAIGSENLDHLNHFRPGRIRIGETGR